MIVLRFVCLCAVSCWLSACRPALEQIPMVARVSPEVPISVVDGKLSAQGDYVALLVAGNQLVFMPANQREAIATWSSPKLLTDTRMISLSDAARYVLSANEKAVQIWQTDQGEPLGSVDFSAYLGDANITCLLFWRAPNKFLIGTSDGSIVFADIENDHYQVSRTHHGEVTQLALSPDRRRLYSGGNDGQVVQWDLSQAQSRLSRTLPFRITSLAVAGNDKVFISDALEEQVVWHTDQNEIVAKLNYWQRYQWFRLALFSPDGKWLITSSPKTEVFMWNLAQHTAAASWQIDAHGFGSTVEDMTWLGQAQIRTLSSDGVIQDWDLSSLISYTSENQATQAR